MLNDNDFYLKDAQYELEIARERNDIIDVSDNVNNIREFVRDGRGDFSDVGTTESELYYLEQNGYKSEAKTSLEIARETYGRSRFALYVRSVRNVGWCFFTTPSVRNFKWLLSVLVRINHDSQKSCIKYVKKIRELAQKGRFSLDEITTKEKELKMIEG
ncbi:hypothetical protein MNBD_BACTEROID05-87 [hydrothermal vent metagenome]|uniref:Uncharacterized protein n=1 Tax=hydrothermal vent metagenome TaxID=652676 RepID=A0A3B0T8P8_9ZZZZ